MIMPQSWDSVLFWYLRYRYSVLENGSFGFGISVLSVFRSFGIGISVFWYRYLRKKLTIFIYTSLKNTFSAFNIFFSPYKTYSKPLNIFQSPSSIILVFLSLWQPAGKNISGKTLLNHVRSRSGQRLEICVFGLLPIETGLSTVERPNSPKTLLYSRRAV